jgi:hypothetical protein
MELSRTPSPKFLPRQTRYCLGADLGQAADPTALSVIEHCHGVLDAGSDHDRHTNQSEHLQTDAKRFRVVHLERLKLGTPYGDVVRHVKAMLGREPLVGTEDRRQADLVIDAGGVGRGVRDMFVEAGLNPISVQITGGTEVHCTGGRWWNVSKHVLITNLDALLHHDKHPLKFSTNLTESHALAEELRDFERSVGAAGRQTYAARSGKHDDLILSIAIAAWWASRPPSGSGFGVYSATTGVNIFG